MHLKCSLKFSIARERGLRKMLRISTPGSVLGSQQEAARLITDFTHVRRIIVRATQDETSIGRQFVNQGRRHFVIGFIGRCQLGAQRDPDGSHHTGNMQFSAIDPIMPARLHPMGFGVNGGMRDETFLAVFLMPDPTIGPEYGAINGCGATPGGPRLN